MALPPIEPHHIYIMAAPVIFVLMAVLFKLLHFVLLLCDSYHRSQCRAHQKKWPFKTVPHLRKIRAKAVTDPERWELVCEEGRQRWMYRDSKVKHRFVEKYMLGLTKEQSPKMRKDYKESLSDGIEFLLKLQDEDGHWPNDYSGPLFLTPGAVICKYIVCGGRLEEMFPEPIRLEYLRYLYNIQNEDGGFGMHTESHSTMFGSCLNYIAMRLLGEPADSKYTKPCCEWIRSRGGAMSVPSWGKVWMAVLNLYDWRGVAAIPPEMWLFPYFLPICMGRIWCHSRIVTLPFGYLYGLKFQCKMTSVLEELRREMYLENYDNICWPKQRYNVYSDDIYTPHSFVYRLANEILLIYEKFHVKSLRKKALDVSMEHIRYDDENTNYICLGPVNKSLNMLCTWIHEGNSLRLQKHFERVQDYMWLGPDGMRMSGYNGSQLWDTAFATQAICAAGPEVMSKHTEALFKAHGYIDVAQVREDPPEMEKFYRCRTKGCWNFSTRNQGWQVSDCTAQGLRVTLILRQKNSGVNYQFPAQRIFDGVDEILSLRWKEGDGAWGSYEPPRGARWLELLNCAEVYKDIMIDYTYCECSSDCIATLCLFREQFPEYRTAEVNEAITQGCEAVRGKQRADGSWYGSWACCFTYGAWLSTEGLLAAEGRKGKNEKCFRKACEFLLSKQREDGGWGEDFNSCVTQHWVENPDGSQVVNTAWAVMSLIAAGGKTHLEAIERGIKFIMSRQLADGDWKQERISGVFNGNCAIHYPAYKNNMTVWALSRYHALITDQDTK